MQSSGVFDAKGLKKGLREQIEHIPTDSFRIAL